MRIQKYHLFWIVVLFALTSCGVVKKKRCNTCPNFSLDSTSNSTTNLV